MSDPRRVVIVPCSGIGKTYGSVSREAAYDVTQDLRPDTTELVPLSLLVLGDEVARAAVADAPAITIDGCKLACATKMVKESGGVVAHEVAVLEVFQLLVGGPGLIRHSTVSGVNDSARPADRWSTKPLREYRSRAEQET